MWSYGRVEQRNFNNGFKQSQNSYSQKKDTILPGVYENNKRICTSRSLWQPDNINQQNYDLKNIEEEIRSYYLKRKQQCALLENATREQKLRFVKACDEFVDSALDILLQKKNNEGEEALKNLIGC